jgi:DNA-binding beta-propeller fold protein YncE
MTPPTPFRRSYFRNTDVRSALLAFALLATSSFCGSIALGKNEPLKNGTSFLNFESAQVRPIAVAPSGAWLFVVNTPDARLAIFNISDGGLRLSGEVPVGLEPVAVAARTNPQGRIEAWVVNNLSDSVSVVELDSDNPAASRVTRTLLVGDEPQDILFAGHDGRWAFITTARRGQNCPIDPLLTTAGIPRALLWVFDSDAPPQSGITLKPVSIIELFSDSPRALAASPDGLKVYAAVFLSGNRTTSIAQPVLSRNGISTSATKDLVAGVPRTALIVKFKEASKRWEDDKARDLSSLVPFSLPDKDVFVIDAAKNPPGLADHGAEISGVGTVLFSMSVRPDNGTLYVANLESRNDVRFESKLRGHLVENRITLIKQGKPVVVHLNPQIHYGSRPGLNKVIEQSVALPVSLAFSADGRLVYVAAQGSDKVLVLETDKLEKGIVARRLISVGSGPSGLAMDSRRLWLYVLNRFENSISIVDTLKMQEIGRVPVGYDPSPAIVRDGRRFLYSATHSAFGDQACASCHIFGNMDGLAWDLGEPKGKIARNLNPYRLTGPLPRVFHPLKGPMVTQSLRGLLGAGPMHWRGDRTAADDPGGNALNEEGALNKFNAAFQSLMGSTTQLSPRDMRSLNAFILSIRYPPNPIRALDNTLTPQQAQGEKIFLTKAPIDPTRGPCIHCHRLPLGTDGMMAYDVETQDFKIPHLRNLYQKVGMFGFSPGTFFPARETGDQVRGFGFLHDGSFDTIFTFLHSPILFFARPPDQEGENERRAVESFLLTFDTGLRPIVGQQVTVGKSNANDIETRARVALFVNRANAGDCELVAKAVESQQTRSWLFVNGSFKPDRTGEQPRDLNALLAITEQPGQEVTFTCVPLDTGIRMALDRDSDGFMDGDELLARTNPANPASVPDINNLVRASQTSRLP